MANLKSLAKDTAIYGLRSIVGRFLNYLLVPLYTQRLGRLRHQHEHLCLYGTDPGAAHIRYGNDPFPFCQR